MKHFNLHNCPKCTAPIPDEAPGGLCPKCALEGVAKAPTTIYATRKSAPPSIAEIATHFPELEILELIGAGGMGAVYKARQPQLDRFVALKILSHDLAEDPTFVERFNREARVLGRLSHPNIVGIHDFGTAGPYCFLTMELVDGVNLRQAMQAGRFTPSEALAMVQHLCSALAYAHAEGILHRDIKPENILIDSKGRVKIADFGIAKLVGEDREHDFTLTLQGSVLGSPHYMAPEQIETPGDVDQRADIYSLGVVLYEMLTGGLPIGRFALPSEKAAMDARIDHIVMRTLEKERDARYQSAGEVSTEVEALSKSPAPPVIKASASPAEPESARFSLAAAILTGISIPLVILGFELDGPRDFKSILEIVKILCLSLGAISAILGFIFGARALGEIRRSGGVKTGLGSAIFATTAWPILVFLSMGQLFMKMPSSGEGGSIPLFMVIIVVLLPVLVAAWLLIRSLYRWAGGVEHNDGTRFHPSLGIPVLISILLAIGGPVLLTEIAVRILPAGPDPYAEARRMMEPGETKGVSVPHETTPVDWYQGLPEVRILLVSNPEIEVEFQLIRSLTDSPDENRLQTTKLGMITSHQAKGGWIQRPGSSNYEDKDRTMIASFIPPYNTCIFLGTTASRKDGAGLTALCDWDKNRKVAINMDFQDWQFATDLPNKLVFSEEGVSDYVVATKAKGNNEAAEKLVLRVVVADSHK